MGIDSGINLPWEYHAQLRPTLQPVIFIGLYKICLFMGIDNPYHQMFLLRLISSLLSFTALLLLAKYALKEFDIHGKWDKLFIIFPVLLMWYVPYVSVRFSSENWSTIFFIYGFILSEYVRMKRSKKWIYYLLPGIIFGLAYQFRYQTALMTGGYILWLIFIKKENIKNLSSIIFGFLIVLGLCFWLDSWFYEKMVFPSWNYLKFNFTQSAATFGAFPWYFYFLEGSDNVFLPIGIMILISLIYFIFRKPTLPYIWIILPFLFVHVLLKHKELRFLFCLLPFLHVCTGYFVYQIWKGKFHKKYLLVKIIRIFIISLIILNILVIIPMASKAASVGYMSMSNYLHHQVGNRKLNLIAFPWSSPYSPWKNPPFPQYAEKNMNQYFIDNVNQLNDSLIIPDCVNYLTIRDYDLNTEVRSKIEQLGFVLVKTSVPVWVVNLNNFFMGKQPRMYYIFKYAGTNSK